MNMHNKKSKRYYIIAIIILFIGACCVALYWRFSSPTNTSSDKNVSSQTSENNRPSGDDEGPDKDTPSEDPDTTAVPSDNNEVSTPATSPSINDPYPVTNEHYQIKQIRGSNYQITLYPIINNPEFSDYNAQLKAYKQEALDYLNKRYGSTAGLNIEWIPEDAASL